MTKKTLRRWTWKNSLLSLLVVILLLPFACREDHINNLENHSVENRNTQFFNTDFQKLTSLQQKAFQQLEDKNEKTHFVTNLKDIKGLPQWETLKFLNSNSNEYNYNSSKNQLEYSNGDGLYSVPLTKDGKITSILYFEVLNEKVISTKEIKNIELWNIINNEKIEVHVREFLLSNCLQYDHELFGNYLFINIPNGLLGIKEGMPNKVRIDTQYNASQKLAATRTCIEFILNCTCTGGVCDECDDNGQCVPYRFCSTSDFNGGGSGGNSDNGGGNDGSGTGGSSNGGDGTSEGNDHATGGGGFLPDEDSGGSTGGSSGGSNPKDPCTESPEQFYRIAPICGGSGGDDNNFDDNDTPCEKLKKLFEEPKPTSLPAGTVSIKTAIQNLKGEAVIATQENGYTFFYNPNNGKMYAREIPNEFWLDNNNLQYEDGNNVFGGAHLHYDGLYLMFSHADIMTLGKLALSFEPSGSTENIPMPVHLLIIDGTVYAITFENNIDKEFFVQKILEIYGDKNKKREFKNSLQREFSKYQTDDIINLEKTFMKFITKIDSSNKHYDLKMSLYQANDQLTNWEKLDIVKENNEFNIKTTSCN